MSNNSIIRVSTHLEIREKTRKTFDEKVSEIHEKPSKSGRSQ